MREESRERRRSRAGVSSLSCDSLTAFIDTHTRAWRAGAEIGESCSGSCAVSVVEGDEVTAEDLVEEDLVVTSMSILISGKSG